MDADSLEKRCATLKRERISMHELRRTSVRLRFGIRWRLELGGEMKAVCLWGVLWLLQSRLIMPRTGYRSLVGTPCLHV